MLNFDAHCEPDEGMVVEKAGLSDTIQDLGRWGHQATGMVVAGAMDQYAYQLGNILLGNSRNAASLEVTMVGPRLRFTQQTSLVITGGDLSPRLNYEPVPLWKVLTIQENDVLLFRAAVNGCRSYIAIKGGFQTPNVLGSLSTYIKGKIGGYKGRALKKEDVIPYSSYPDLTSPVNSTAGGKRYNVRLSPDMIPHYTNEITVRIVPGPQDDYFTGKGVSTLFDEVYRVTSQMDRMGIRLKGPSIEHRDGADIISDAMPFGGIQVPENGQPIILMADRQTTGGYTKIGCVISVDLPKIAQMQPNQMIRFQKVTVQEAQRLFREQDRSLRTLELLSHLDYNKKMNHTLKN